MKEYISIGLCSTLYRNGYITETHIPKGMNLQGLMDDFDFIQLSTFDVLVVDVNGKNEDLWYVLQEGDRVTVEPPHLSLVDKSYNSSQL